MPEERRDIDILKIHKIELLFYSCLSSLFALVRKREKRINTSPAYVSGVAGSPKNKSPYPIENINEYDKISVDNAYEPILNEIYVRNEAVQYSAPAIVPITQTSVEALKSPLSVRTKKIIEKNDTNAVKMKPPILCFIVYCLINTPSERLVIVDTISKSAEKPLNIFSHPIIYSLRIFIIEQSRKKVNGKKPTF